MHLPHKQPQGGDKARPLGSASYQVPVRQVGVGGGVDVCVLRMRCKAAVVQEVVVVTTKPLGEATLRQRRFG